MSNNTPSGRGALASNSAFGAEQYEEAAAQFRDDVAVNPADTEEAIWAFLAEAKLLGADKARQQFLQVGSNGICCQTSMRTH